MITERNTWRWLHKNVHKNCSVTRRQRPNSAPVLHWFSLHFFILFKLLQSCYLQLPQLYLCCLLPFSSRLTCLDWRRKTTMVWRRPKIPPVSVKAIESDVDVVLSYSHDKSVYTTTTFSNVSIKSLFVSLCHRYY